MSDIQKKIEMIQKHKDTIIHTEYACTNLEFMANMGSKYGHTIEEEMSSSGKMTKKGHTTYNARHKHEFVVDENGNGTAKQICHPDYPHICHNHKIVNWVVQSAMSQDIDNVYGAPNHIHQLTSRKIKFEDESNRY
jgi:hypothetical protein